MLSLSDFDYDLPKELIAQTPLRPRDRSRLLVLRRRTNELFHRHFSDLADYLSAGDVLVLNDTKVFPARLAGRKAKTGGAVEAFLLRRADASRWHCLIGAKGGQAGLELEFGQGLKGVLLANNQDGTWLIEFSQAGAKLDRAIKRIGQVPLPPYIKRQADGPSQADRSRYQTVFAAKERQGSAAAPTAGLHFTPRLLKRLEAKGVRLEYITLHVGLGTFAPVKTDDIDRHKMHAEWYEVGGQVLARLLQAKAEGRRVVAVGTTVARTLETVAAAGRSKPGDREVFSGWTDIFIRPGYHFRLVGGLVTNFHTPKSTLLMLVSAFAGQGRPGERAGLEMIQAAYAEAIGQRYRFFSYGDAMFLD